MFYKGNTTGMCSVYYTTKQLIFSLREEQSVWFEKEQINFMSFVRNKTCIINDLGNISGKLCVKLISLCQRNKEGMNLDNFDF